MGTSGKTSFAFALAVSLAATPLTVQTQVIAPSLSIQISQADAPLLWGADFVVAEDGVIFITDAKDGNIKCYDSSGKLLNVIGRRGPGPLEFLGPSFCDYQPPFLSILDGARKIHVYERVGRAGLSKLGEISCLMCTSDVVLSGKSVLVDAYVHNNDGEFSLTVRGFNDALKCLLPSYRRYGFDSERELRASYSDLSKLTAQRGFLAVFGNRIYFVFDVRPVVTVLNLDGSGIVTFSSLSPNYREPRINGRIRDAFFEPGREGEIKAERNKVSYITGILADDGMVGVLFSNYDAPTETWQLYLLRFDLDGKLVSEACLREAINYGSLFSYYYQRVSGRLYVMTERYGNETDDYRILGYNLR